MFRITDHRRAEWSSGDTAAAAGEPARGMEGSGVPLPPRREAEDV